MLATVEAPERVIPAADHVRPNVSLLRALAEARAVYRVPAYAIAAAADISPGLLSMMARGRVRATERNAVEIARALGRPVDELFPGVARRQGAP